MGFEQAGWKTLWQVENNPFCRAVLATRFPDAERSVTDVRNAGSKNLAAVDCITAGVPCQDVSVAGKRAGLKGERTGLFFEFARILQELRPAWFVFENVPGLLSSNRGRDFAEVLRVLMVECGYGVCWRVLDSQFFGVAQRRRRVFIVGRFGEPCPAEVLFEFGWTERVVQEKHEAGLLTANTVRASASRWLADGADNLVANSPPDSTRVRNLAGLPKEMDSARYRALGNAWTTQVAEWIARRIAPAASGWRE